MAKTELPPRNTWNRTLAEAIFEHIKPGNPHGPRSDLFFEMPYVRDSAELATEVANELIEKGWRPPVDEARKDIDGTVNHLVAMARGHVNGDGIRLDSDELRRVLSLAYSAGERGQREPITAEALAKAGPPSIIEPAPEVVSLVSAITNETVDMTIVQALDLRLLLSIKGHESDLYLAQGEEMWLRCTCGKFDINVGGAQEDLEALTAVYIDHLKSIVTAPKLHELPDGLYNDGMYDWEKEGFDWTPLKAPSGMPPKPELARLRRVVIDRKYEAI